MSLLTIILLAGYWIANEQGRDWAVWLFVGGCLSLLISAYEDLRRWLATRNAD